LNDFLKTSLTKNDIKILSKYFHYSSFLKIYLFEFQIFKFSSPSFGCTFYFSLSFMALTKKWL